MKFYLISLGCPKNLTDSEDFCARLIAKGGKMVFDIQQADTVIINTCGFLSSALKEARKNIAAALKLKAKGQIKKVAVTGCMVERLKAEVKKEFPELDLVFSIAEQGNIDKLIKKEGEFLSPVPAALHIPEYKMSLTAPHSAYLKVADGCDNRCAYCAIPYIRGAYRSKPIEDILTEAQLMADNGVKELSLIAQDTTSYGYDIYGKPQIVPLLKKLLKIKNLPRLRIMYAYPHRVTQELADIMASTDRIFHYLDIPLQHISDKILKNMNRHCGKADIIKTLEMLKTTVPDIAIRTNFIVGFPTETEADFRQLKKFVKDFEFDNVGVFEYFRESGTPAYSMDEQVRAAIKQQRALELTSVQSRVIDKINKDLTGKTVEVIADTPAIGRTYRDAPDIDGKVTFTQEVEAGSIFQGKILKAEGYQRVIEPIKKIKK